MGNPLELLSTIPGEAGDQAREIMAAPAMPLETPTQTTARQSNEYQQAQRIERVKAIDLANRGIPAYTDSTGATQPVRDSEGAALTHFDKSHGIAYDSTGNPQKLSYGETGAPKLQDPYASAPVTTDKKTGFQYQAPSGLPWKYIGKDDATAEQVAAREHEKDVSKLSSVMGRQLSLEEHELTRGERDIKNGLKNLAQTVPAFADPTTHSLFDSGDHEAVHAGIDGYFNEQYGAADANRKTGLFSLYGGRTPEAEARRAQLDQQKAQAKDQADKLLGLTQRTKELRQAIDGNRAALGTVTDERVNTALGKLPEEERPYQITNGQLQINPRKPLDGLQAAAADGHIAPPAREQLDAARVQQNRAGAVEAAKAGQKPYGVGADGKIQIDPEKPFDSLHQAELDGLAPNVTQEDRARAWTQQQQTAVLSEAKAGNKPYKADEQNRVVLDPTKPADSLKAAVADGLWSPEEAAKALPQMEELQKHAQELEKLKAEHPVLAKAMAAAHGAAPGAVAGAGFLAGAEAAGPLAAGAAAAFPPAAVVTAPAIELVGGLIGAGISSYLAHKAGEVLSKYTDALKPFENSAEIHPNYDHAGNFVGMVLASKGVGSIAKLAETGSIAAERAGAQGVVDTTKAVAGALGGRALGALGGGVAFEGAIRPAVDVARYAAADALGIPHDKFQAPTAGSIAESAAISLLLMGHGIKTGTVGTPEGVEIMKTGLRRQMEGKPIVGLTREEIMRGVKDGQFDVQGQDASGNKVSRKPTDTEIESLVKEHGGLTQAQAEIFKHIDQKLGENAATGLQFINDPNSFKIKLRQAILAPDRPLNREALQKYLDKQESKWTPEQRTVVESFRKYQAERPDAPITEAYDHALNQTSADLGLAREKVRQIYSEATKQPSVSVIAGTVENTPGLSGHGGVPAEVIPPAPKGGAPSAGGPVVGQVNAEGHRVIHVSPSGDVTFQIPTVNPGSKASYTIHRKQASKMSFSTPAGAEPPMKQAKATVVEPTAPPAKAPEASAKPPTEAAPPAAGSTVEPSKAPVPKNPSSVGAALGNVSTTANLASTVTHEPLLEAAAKKNGVEYQGTTETGHAFKDLETNGNFTLPLTSDLSNAWALIRAKAAQVRATVDTEIGNHSPELIDAAIEAAKTSAAASKNGKNPAPKVGDVNQAGHEVTAVDGDKVTLHNPQSGKTYAVGPDTVKRMKFSALETKPAAPEEVEAATGDKVVSPHFVGDGTVQSVSVRNGQRGATVRLKTGAETFVPIDTLAVIDRAKVQSPTPKNDDSTLVSEKSPMGDSVKVTPAAKAPEAPKITPKPPEPSVPAPGTDSEPSVAVASRSATPDRMRKFTFGKAGTINVVFPDAAHAELYALWPRVEKAIKEGVDSDNTAQRVADAFGITRDEAGKLAAKYLNEVKRGARLALQNKEIAYEAPKADTLSKPGSATAVAQKGEAPAWLNDTRKIVSDADLKALTDRQIQERITTLRQEIEGLAARSRELETRPRDLRTAQQVKELNDVGSRLNTARNALEDAKSVSNTDGSVSTNKKHEAQRTETALALAKSIEKEHSSELKAMGVKGVMYTQTTNASGIQYDTASGRILIDPTKLPKFLDGVRVNQETDGLPHVPADALREAIFEEAWHNVQALVAEDRGMSVREYYQAIPDSEFPEGWQEAVKKSRSDYEPSGKNPGMEDWQKKAEFVRMVMQGKWRGTITEAVYKALRDVLAFLKKIAGGEGVSEWFKGHVAELEARVRKMAPEKPKKAKAPETKVELEPSKTEQAPANPSKRDLIAKALAEKDIYTLEDNLKLPRSFQSRGVILGDGTYQTPRVPNTELAKAKVMLAEQGFSYSGGADYPDGTATGSFKHQTEASTAEPAPVDYGDSVSFTHEGETKHGAIAGFANEGATAIVQDANGKTRTVPTSDLTRDTAPAKAPQPSKAPVQAPIQTAKPKAARDYADDMEDPFHRKDPFDDDFADPFKSHPAPEVAPKPKAAPKAKADTKQLDDEFRSLAGMLDADDPSGRSVEQIRDSLERNRKELLALNQRIAKLDGAEKASAIKQERTLKERLQELSESLQKLRKGGTLDAAMPAIAHAGIPLEHQEAFLKLARNILAHEINTPVAMYQKFRDVAGESKARKYSRALWSMLMSVDPSLPYVADWEPVFSAQSPMGDSSETSDSPTVTDSPQAPASRTPSRTAAEEIAARIKKDAAMSWQQLFEITDRAFKGTQADGTYNVKDAYDAMELGVNLHIKESLLDGLNPKDATPAEATEAVTKLKRLLGLLPTQTKRTAEQDAMQQFSTPPHFSYVANWVANYKDGDVMLESSNGIGGLSVFAQRAGAKVIANELSPRRRALAAELQPDYLFGENAEQLHAILEPKIKAGEVPRPTVVVMNPPFSNAAKSGEKGNTMIGAQHVEEALKLLPEGGRLVTIVGEGMGMDSHAFRAFWPRIQRQYNVRANVLVDGKNYVKYGTTFSNRLIVIDKTGPTPNLDAIVQGSVGDIAELIPLLEGVRNDRPNVTKLPAEQGGTGATGASGRPAGKRPTQPAANAGSAAPSATGNPGGAGGQPGSDGDSGRKPAAAADNGSTLEGSGAAEPDGVRQPAGRGTDDPEHADALPDSGVKLGTNAVARSVQTENEDDVFATYHPSKVSIPGSKGHPADLVESAAMASLAPPDPTYTPNLPREVVEQGVLSEAQIENVVYAGQAHSQKLETGERRGYFIGDGTGVGKGRQISGIILDNMRQGRKRAVWVSKSAGLVEDAKRDASALGIDPDTIRPMKKIKKGQKIDGDGILFSTYDTLKQGHDGLTETEEEMHKRLADKAPTSRIEQIAQWLGRDFDGVIVFDEAHMAGNAVSIKGTRGTKDASKNGMAVVDLQRALPNARVVYVSATGATEIENLSYADRLGIWGPGTPFSQKKDFFSKISAGGISSMEIVARDLKAMGLYLARSISYKGVKFGRLTQELTPEQSSTYDKIAEGFQKVLSTLDESMADTGANNNSMARSSALSAFWGAQQRFFNQVLTAMQMPALLKDMKQQLEDGNSLVLQLVNTNEASQNREIARRQSETSPDAETSLEDLDLSPADILLQYIQTSFPTFKYEKVQNPNDPEKFIWQVAKDSAGNPIQDPAAIASRDRLLDEVSTLDIPSNPIEQILNTFGVESVAEVTGRSQRVVQVQKEDGTRKTQIERRTEAHRQVEAKEFQDGKRRILLFSQAGGTGYSFHADRTAKNQQQRIHYLVQAGWRADAAIQGFGRTHRTNQASAPEYKLAETNIPGHKRFISTIARRLAQLGALTTGERKSAGQGMFSESDNLEGTYADDAMKRLIYDLHSGNVEGATMDDFARSFGFIKRSPDPETGEYNERNTLIDPQTGALNEDKVPSIQTFLNRILVSSLERQRFYFNQFSDRMEARVERAKEDGTYDPGTQVFRAGRIEKVADEVLYTHPGTSAATRLVEVRAVNPVDFNQFEDVQRMGPVLKYVRNKRSARVYALREGMKRTDTTTGAIVPTFRRVGTRDFDSINQSEVKDDAYETVPESSVRELWEKEIAEAPKERAKKTHFLVGAMLPIWDRIQIASPKIYRFTTSEGESMLGVLVPEKEVFGVRNRLGAKNTLTPEAAFNAVLENSSRLTMANGWVIRNAYVSGDHRIEVEGMGYDHAQDFVSRMGGTMERIQFRSRYFVQTDPETGVATMKKLMAQSPVVAMDGQSLANNKGPATLDADAPLLTQLEAAYENDDLEAMNAIAEQAGLSADIVEKEGAGAYWSIKFALQDAARAKSKPVAKPAKPATQAEYKQVADAMHRQAGTNQPATRAQTPSAQDREAILAAYKETVAKAGSPSVRIADVLERAGFSLKEADRAKGAVMALYQSGDITSLGLGDWSLVDDRVRAWSVVALPGEASVLMRMANEYQGGTLDADAPNLLRSGARVIAGRRKRGTVTKIDGDQATVALDEGGIIGAPLRTLIPEEGGRLDAAMPGTPILNRSIDSVLSRINPLTGAKWFWEGTADVLQRNGFTDLAAAVWNQQQVSAKEFADAWKPIRRALAALDAKGRKTVLVAKRDWELYFRHKESGRDTLAAGIYRHAAPESKSLIDAWKQVAKETGLSLQNHDVHVQDGDKWRPIGHLGADYFPRKIAREVMEVLRDRSKHAAEWTKLVQDLIDNGNITDPAEADRFLKERVFEEKTESDYYANIERARKAKLPESWLEYRFDEVAPWYVTNYSRRIAQIVAYGQQWRPGGDLWEQTLATVPGTPDYTTTQAYIKAARDAAYFTRTNTEYATFLKNLQAMATGTFLSNPFSAVRNLISGVTQTSVMFGPVEGITQTFKAMMSAADQMTAHDKGVMREDVFQIMMEGLDDTTLSQKVRKAANFGMTYTGFNVAENWVRTGGMLSAMNFARKAAEEMNRDMGSAKSLQYMAVLRRMHADPLKIANENGSGDETDRFIRQAVIETQGGYTFAQTPLRMTEPTIAFLTQFQKWGTQMTRFLAKHVIEPAVGVKAKDLNPALDGTPQGERVVRDFKPLLFAIALAIGGGELLYLTKDLLTGRRRGDASIEEMLSVTQDGQHGEALGMVLGRVISDIIMAGTLGILSDYGANLKEFATRGRFKNPFDPPGIQFAKNLVNGVKLLVQQHTLTGRNVADLIETQLPGVAFGERLARRVTGDTLHDARNVAALARDAGLRMAKETGMPIAAPFGGDSPIKSPSSPFYDRLRAALLAGNTADARTALKERLDGKNGLEQKRIIEGLRSSVSSGQPVRVGGIASAANRQLFFEWARNRLPAADLARIRELDSRYWRTATEIGAAHGEPIPQKPPMMRAPGSLFAGFKKS